MSFLPAGSTERLNQDKERRLQCVIYTAMRAAQRAGGLKKAVRLRFLPVDQTGDGPHPAALPVVGLLPPT